MLKKIDYLGGLNTMASLLGVPDGQLSTMQDFVLRGNSLVGRFGAYTLGATGNASAVDGIFYYIDGSQNEWFILYAHTGHKVYAAKNVSGSLTITDITGAANPGTFTGFEVLNGILFIGTQTTGLYQWNGAGNIAAVGGNSPAAVGSMEVVNNFLFVGGYLNSRVSWSNVGDGTTWSVANFLDFRKGDGDYVIALSSIGEKLIIFKNYTTGILITTTLTVSGAVTLGPLSTIIGGVGCQGPHTHDQLPNGMIILLGSDFHSYLFDGNIFTDISDQQYPLSNIQNSWENIYATGWYNWMVRVNPLRHEALIFQIASGVNSLVYAYDYLNGFWSKRTLTNLMSAYFARSNVGTGRGFRQINNTTVNALYGNAAFLLGDSSGNFYIDDVSGQADTTGSNPSPQLVFSLLLPADYKSNIPFYFTIPVKCSSTATVTFAVGRDGTFGSNQTYSTLGINVQSRLKIPLLSAAYYSSQQVKISVNDTNTWTFDSAYISDEVMV